MLIKNILFNKYVVLLIIILVFYIKGLIFIDPDFGWRIRAGEYYWNNGFPETDIFTYTMPNFPWVDHAWGISLIFFLVNNFLGYPVLVLLMSSLILAIILILFKSVSGLHFEKNMCKDLSFPLSSKYLPWFFVNINLNKIFPFSFFPFILVISILLPFFGVRAQIFSWLMFSILIYLLSTEKIYLKKRMFLPVFFLLWANLHGSFTLGMFILLFYLVLRLFRQNNVFSKDSFIGLLSFMATFLNPYGIGVWREAWSSATDPRLRWSIAEWMPALTMFDLSMVFLICLSIVFVWKYKRKYSIFELGLFLFLFIQAISSKRQLPFWAVFSFPLIARGILFFWNELVKIKNGRLRFLNIYKAALVVSIFIFIFQASFSIKDSYAISLGKFYPVSAINYLKQSLPEGEVFSEYGWGGYLIWRLPQKKVFIDGRMPSWRWNPEDVNDLSSAFDTYNGMLKGEEDYKKIFDKFGICTVLARKTTGGEKNPFYEKVEGFLKLFGWKENDFDLFRALEEDEWKKVYEDNVAVIYSKN